VVAGHMTQPGEQHVALGPRIGHPCPYTFHWSAGLKCSIYQSRHSGLFIPNLARQNSTDNSISLTTIKSHSHDKTALYSIVF